MTTSPSTLTDAEIPPPPQTLPLAEHDLIKGKRIGVDASTMEANAALRAIVRRDSGETTARC